MRRATWVVVAAAALLLSGCSEIPMSGPARIGVTAQPSDPNIVYIPQPPAQNANQQDIVNGFVQAASAGGDFAVAKQFLTPSFAAKWNPHSRVLVQEQSSTLVVNGKNDISLQVPTSAVVTATGIYTPSTQTKRLDFHLVQQANGQWRIDSAQNGIALGQSVFIRKYQPATLQFFDPSYTRLVPEVRWLPVRSDPAPGIVAALVDGPSDPIAGGITANALAGAKLKGAATAPNGVTTVVLTVNRTPTTQLTDRMQQQLIRSLGLQGPSAMQLSVNDRIAPQTKVLDTPTSSQQPYVLAQGRFGTLGPSGAVTEDRTLGKRLATLKPRALTVASGQGLAAVLTGPPGNNSVEVVTTKGNPRVVDRRIGLIAPTIDQQGWTYSVPTSDTTGLQASSATGKTVEVTADLGGSTVAAIEASPDGTRMLVLTNSASGPSAFVAGIRRSADGTPTALTGSDARYRVIVDPGTGVDATWVDDASVAVLTLSTDGSDRVRVQPLGGLSRSLGQPTNAESIVGATGTSDQSPVLAQLSGGVLQGWVSNVWQSPFPNPVEVSVLAVQR